MDIIGIIHDTLFQRIVLCNISLSFFVDVITVGEDKEEINIAWNSYCSESKHMFLYQEGMKIKLSVCVSVCVSVRVNEIPTLIFYVRMLSDVSSLIWTPLMDGRQ
jgi:hypothetical protein